MDEVQLLNYMEKQDQTFNRYDSITQCFWMETYFHTPNLEILSHLIKTGMDNFVTL